MVLKVILFGSTGSVGYQIKMQLISKSKSKYDVITIGRDDSDVEIQCNMKSYDEIKRCMKECVLDNEEIIVISCLGGRNASDCEEVDGDMNCNIINASKCFSNIKRFILLSGACVDNPKIPLQYAKIRAENALMNSGINYTIFRPTCYYKCFHSMWEKVNKNKKVYVIGNGEYTRFGPMDERDVASAMIEYGMRETKNDVIYLDGEKQYTAKSIANELSSNDSDSDNVKHVPYWFVRGVEWIGGYILPTKIYETIRLIVYYNLYQMNIDNVDRCIKLDNKNALSYFEKEKT
jgi:divinyl chlorophyllide a 8-vinyl-reductase